MTTQTNAQAALLAAATVYTGSKGNVSVETVTGMASMFKRSLDKADRDDQQRWVRERDATPTPPRVPGARPAPVPLQRGYEPTPRQVVEQCPVWQCTQPKGHEDDEHPDIVEKPNP